MTEAVLANPSPAKGRGQAADSERVRPRRRRSKILWFAATALGLVLLLGALAGVKASQIAMLIDSGKQAAKAGPPPETVSTMHAQKQTWEKTLNAIGSVVSAKGVAVSNDAPGVVSRIRFESGDRVKKGQVLVELDAKVEQAQLRSIRARRALAKISFDRALSLVRSGAIAQSSVDADAASFKSLTAEQSALEAQIARKVIRAPFGGRLGIRQVNLGQYLAPGSVVTVLESVESVYVDFSLPQHDLDSISVGMPVRAPEQDADTAMVVEGTITAIDSGVDAATRTVKVRAGLPAQDRLRPGMFVRVQVVLPQRAAVVAVPATSIVHASYGDSIFSIETVHETPPEDGQRTVARQRFVKLGPSRGDFVAVAEGLTVGAEVVVAGAFKLRNNAPVAVDNGSVVFDPKLAPNPKNR